MLLCKQLFKVGVARDGTAIGFWIAKRLAKHRQKRLHQIHIGDRELSDVEEWSCGHVFVSVSKAARAQCIRVCAGSRP